MKKLLPFLVICFCSQIAFGQGEPVSQQERTELDADRPSKGDASKIVPKGYYQLETGIHFEKDETNFVSDKIWHLPELTFGQAFSKLPNSGCAPSSLIPCWILNRLYR